MQSRDGRLEVGDELVNVNGANMRGLTTDQVSAFFGGVWSDFSFAFDLHFFLPGKSSDGKCGPTPGADCVKRGEAAGGGGGGGGGGEEVGEEEAGEKRETWEGGGG